jgi:hypothetical protein
MNLFQLIFKGGRVQNLMADHWSHQEDVIRFQEGLTTHEFHADSVIRIDELTDHGGTESAGDEATYEYSTAA